MSESRKKALDALVAIVEDTTLDDDVRIRAAGTILANTTTIDEKVGATA